MAYQPQLHQALDDEDYARAELLVRAGACLTVRSELLGDTALHYMGYPESFPLLRLALRRSPPLDHAGFSSTPLGLAVSYGTPESVRLMLGAGADVHARDREGATPLLHACGNPLDATMTRERPHAPDGTGPKLEPRACMATALLAAGARVSDRGGDDKYTPLHLAVLLGRTDLLDLLLSAGADVQATDLLQRTPLHLARSGALVRWLVERGAAVDARDCWGLTPLHRAVLLVCRESCEEVVEALLAAGADVSLRDYGGRTAYDRAIRYRWTSLDPHLMARLRRSASPDSAAILPRVPRKAFRRYLQLKHSPLALNSGYGLHWRVPLFDLLGAPYDRLQPPFWRPRSGHRSSRLSGPRPVLPPRLSPLLLDRCGRSPLHLAAARDDERLTRHLLTQGSEVDRLDEWGMTPLHVAALMDSPASARALLQAGADARARGGIIEAGPLHHAACWGHVRVARTLLGWGVSPNDDTCFHDAAPLHWCRDPETASFLLQRGADLHCLDHLGRSALHWAVDGKLYRLVRFLRQLGLAPDSLDETGSSPRDFALDLADPLLLDALA